MNFLIIYFNETASDQMLFVALAIRHIYNLTERPGYDPPWGLTLTRSHHSMSFTASSLAIGKDGPIVSLDAAVN